MADQGTVLVVDDEIGPRESIRMILHPLYQVYTASNGEEALACIKNRPIDLVTLDMRMPGLSGLDVLKEIKETKLEVDVLIVSGYMNSQNTQEAKQGGAVEVITKPFNVTDIVASVGKLVERKKYTRKMKELVDTVKSLGLVEEKQIDDILYH